MRDSDYKKFSEMHDAACALLSRGKYVASATSVALFFRALQRFELSDVARAFDAHVARSSFVPVPHDILEILVGEACADGRPSADEAWAEAIKAGDESVTVVWTEEAARAFEASRPLLDVGDKVAARKSFIAAYERFVADARAACLPVRWMPSYGYDAAARNATLLPHVAAGRLPESVLHVETAPITDLLLEHNGSPALLTGPADGKSGVAPPAEDVRALLAELVGKLAAPREVGESVDAANRARTSELKARMAQQIADYGCGRAGA